MNKDLEHLRLLSIFHYVVGGILALFACFPILHLTMGVFLLLAPFPENNAKPHDAAFLRAMGAAFVIIPAAIILLGWTLAVLTIIAGRKLSQAKNYTFCLVVAGIICIFMPFGTVLGVFTIIVLLRDSVKAIFNGQASPGASFGSMPSDWK